MRDPISENKISLSHLTSIFNLKISCHQIKFVFIIFPEHKISSIDNKIYDAGYMLPLNKIIRLSHKFL